MALTGATVDGLVRFLEANPEAIGTLLAALLGTGGYVRRGQRRGNLPPLRYLPWPALRGVFNILRRTVWSKPWPDKDGVKVDLAVEEARRELEEAGYNPFWEFSHYKTGELINCRDWYRDGSRRYPRRQIHIRMREHPDDPDALEAVAHDEPAPDDPGQIVPHLSGDYQRDATEWFAEGWPDRALDPETFREEKEAD